MFIEPYLGNITVFAGNFAPRAWMFCQGQLLSIAANDALFALIGTTYGGDGQVTFALPDFRGRVANHMGQGPGLSNYVLGQVSGTENVTLISTQMPGHTHSLISLTVSQSASTATTSGLNNPQANYPASGATVYNSSTDNTTMGNYSSVGVTPIAGGNNPFSIQQPTLAMNFVIAVEGIFPSRN
ncbi:MAG: tail fiber protein [Bacteroidota bacterium]|nr:tail fiber protein [Bacteroidota bacterium]